MFRCLVRALVAVFVLVPLTGCGGGGDSSVDRQSRAESARPQPKGESSGPRIEEKAEPLEVPEGFEIKPYFDEDATLTQRAVSPGERFELYIVLGYPDPHHVNALEYRLEFPAGVSIVAESKFDHNALTIGDPLEDFSIAYRCIPPGKYYVMRYECEVGEEFAGGEIRTTPGVNKYGNLFLGVVTCDGDPVKVPAEGGIALLSRN